MVAQPPFSTKSPCDQLSAFFRAALLAAASPACWNLSAQMGASADTTAVSARCDAWASALPPVTHPPQVNPTIAIAIAPPAMPHRAGFVSTGIFMGRPFGERDIVNGRQHGTRFNGYADFQLPYVRRRTQRVLPAGFSGARLLLVHRDVAGLVALDFVLWMDAHGADRGTPSS